MLIVRCPVPPEVRSKIDSHEVLYIKLQPIDSRDIKENSRNGKNMHRSSKKFGTCPIPHKDFRHVYEKENDIYINNKVVYNISICSSVRNYDKLQLIEWIEYHRMIGIEHFYIYDTNYNSSEYIRNNIEVNRIYNNSDLTHRRHSVGTIVIAKSSIVQDTLRVYIQIGLVTVVKWPYPECAEYMACDNPIYFSEVNLNI